MRIESEPKTYRQPWRTTEARWLKRNGLQEKGLSLVLIRRKDGRQVRDDFTINRYTLPKPEADRETVCRALSKLRSIILTNLDARRLEMKLKRPNGDPVGPNMRMANLRNFPDLPTQEEKEAAELEELEVEVQARHAHAIAREIDEMTSSPTIATRVALRALREFYGAHVLKDAFDIEVAPYL